MLHVIRRDVNGLVIMVQLKRNLFLGIAFVAPEPKPKIEEDLHVPHKGKKYSVHEGNCGTKEKDSCPGSTEQC